MTGAAAPAWAAAGSRVILVDNYDSFSYNLVQECARQGFVPRVFRNDALSLPELEAQQPSHLLISPGPGEPADAGISCAAIRHFAGRIPVLGVCLGHQCLAEVFGGRTVPAARMMHGKTSAMRHDGRGLFAGLPQPFEAMRYHSLIVSEADVPACLEVSCRSDDQAELMGLRHRELPWLVGVQFHPESFRTPAGGQLLANFLRARVPVGAGHAG